MRRLAFVLGVSLVTACAVDDEIPDEDLGDIGDGKGDSFGVVDRAFTVDAGKSRRFTFAANAAFRVAVTQPDTAVSKRSPLTLSLKKPDGDRQTADAADEPTIVVEDGGDKFTLTVRNVGTRKVSGVLNVRPLGGFGQLPNPNAATAPDVTWLPPALSDWPDNYVIFNNTGCGHDCTQTDSSALAPRSVMIKMLVAAIDNVKPGGLIRVSNFNISSSNSAKPVLDALVRAMQTKNARVRVVMDEGQNNATSRTTLLAQQGADVRFLDGIHFTTSSGTPSEGIMHSKIVIVDDEVLFTGSNNFSSTGFITNEENSVVLRGAANANRIAGFACDVDKMFAIGVPAGKPQRTDTERRADILALDACNGPDVWFPPSGTLATGSAITFTEISNAIKAATKSIHLAPDMLAHPGVISAIVSRAKKAKTDGKPFEVKLVLDASDEALGNPAFGECLADAARLDDLDIAIRYWPGNHEIFQLLHHKFMIIDAEDPALAAVYNGSANYSAKAFKHSFENVTRYTNATHRALVDAFVARFHRLFADGKTRARVEAEDGLDVPDCVL